MVRGLEQWPLLYWAFLLRKGLQGGRCRGGGPTISQIYMYLQLREEDWPLWIIIELGDGGEVYVGNEAVKEEAGLAGRW